MKYVVTVADKKFEVEIEDIFARPVIARVDGQEFKISPETGSPSPTPKETKEFKPGDSPKPLSTPTISANELTAPLPGVVTEVFFKPGEAVEMGQVVLIIEAMKMKDSIRSTRAGLEEDLGHNPG